ncbi:hypothetical protein F3Y22_tig00110895pilonHSYRG00533 [Hibiscus syriacus]|uniref:Patatin n=1 Tax=Hibiscus syriacus TaxID=106335 RepID=A0A6A2ZFX5_HIBSY|nr:hypothetical protein F3Y22_tig00110895pilonHSYRG00533 [Hibiscus syriacus]
MENTSYFVASKHKLSTFFFLIFRSPTSYHPLLASSVSRLIMQDQGNRLIVGKDENTARQLIRMINSDNLRLPILLEMFYSEMLIRCDIVQPIETILKSPVLEDPVSVLQLVATLAYGSDTVAQKMLTTGVMSSLEKLFDHKNTEVQRLALLAVGNLAFCRENRQLLVTSKSLRGTGKRMHELFDLICGTSTSGIFSAALGIKLMSADQLEEIYRNLGKVVFSEPVPKDNKVASWRNKLDRLYRSSSQNFRVVAKGSKYPVGTPEVPLGTSESSGTTMPGSPTTGIQAGCKRSAFVGSCKHLLWQAIRASCAAPYYLDDFSDGSKGGWRYLDAGQVLIVGACSVDHAEEASRTLLPMHTEIHYFRFNPVGERCGMELDETDPTVWLNLEDATRDFIEKNSESFKNVCERLVKNG